MNLTLSQVLTSALKRHAPRTAIIVDNTPYSYGELDDLSTRLAAGFQAMGLTRGSTVALFLPNCIEYVVADLAILKCGAIKVPLNKYQSASEISFILGNTEAQLLIADGDLLQHTTGLRLPLSLHKVVVRGDLPPLEINLQHWTDALLSGPVALCDAAPQDTATITYTGGTTGQPKGVVQVQESLAINLTAHINAADIRAEEVMLLATPLAHSAGYHMQACLLQGGRIILQDEFDPSHFIATVAHHRVTWTFLVPTMIYRLLDDPALRSQQLSSLHTVVYGAAPMSATRLQHALEHFGPKLIQLYGQTECPNFITALTKEDHLNPALWASCGKAVPFAEIRLHGAEGEAHGEVVVRSPYLLKEYHRNPGATGDALRNGWLHTGDIGCIDEDGYLFLKDRAKDMVISGGMNVYTIEVEQALKAHAAVADAAVIGVPDNDWGELVHAVVVSSGAVTGEALIRHCKATLSKYKVPKSLSFIDQLPLTNYGKVDKKALREQVI